MTNLHTKQWSTVWQQNLAPIIAALFGGLMIGSLFLIVAAVTFMVGFWVYGFTFGVLGLIVCIGPVLFIIAYLWFSDGE